jgi:thiol-disulfide isomerase/thioredoxin
LLGYGINKIYKMKKNILSFFVILIIISCSQKVNNQISKKTIITGQVSNFDKVSEHDFVEIIFPDLLAGQKKVSQQIDEKGQFRFEIDLNKPTEFNLKYSGYLTFYIFPGDSLHFAINSDCWSTTTDTYQEESDFYKVSGTSEKMNSDVTKFMGIYRDSLLNWQANSDSVKNMDALDFIKFKNNQLKALQSSSESFNLSENTCDEFRKWSQYFIKYDNWSNIMEYRWAHAMAINENPGLYVTQMPVEYFDFLKNRETNRSEEQSVSTYLNFLHEYAMYIDQLIPLDSQKVYFANMKDEFDKGAGFFLRYYNQVEKGFLKDVLISKFYYRMLDAKYYAQIKNTFNTQLIEDKELREQVQQKYDYEKSLFEKPQFSEGSILNELKDENDFLQALIKKYPEKVIYIDFWAPWCSPCMSEMPASQKIKKQFENKDVAFVYLANRCEEDAWKTTIAEQKIEGEHYSLTDKQFTQLREIFGITGIPHYALIDKKGNIINEKAPRPSSGSELIDLINTNLD